MRMKWWISLSVTAGIRSLTRLVSTAMHGPAQTEGYFCKMTKASAAILPNITPLGLVGGLVGSLGTFIKYPINTGIPPNITPLGSVVFAKYLHLICRQYGHSA